MDADVAAVCGTMIAAFGVWLYFMFGTRRTVLRVFGWIVGIFAIGYIFVYYPI
jgi:hypothetical protein